MSIIQKTSGREMNRIQELEQRLQYNEKLKYVTGRINSADNIDEILVNLKDDIQSLFDAEGMTIYAFDSFDFAAAMRSFLRADPDVIMVGEMRDYETAATGIEASLTGHLVFSTLHTNSAPETVTRLIDLGIDPFNFADSLLGIMAQRLIRTFCIECKEPYHPSGEEFDELAELYGKGQFTGLGIDYNDDLVLYRAKGCEACGMTGYRGRAGIYELLLGTDDMKRLIQAKSPVEQIRQQAINDGMKTLFQDGIQKVFQGICDIKMVRRVCIV